MSGDIEVTTVTIQSQVWLLSQKEKHVHLPFLPGHRKHFTAIKFQPATDLFDRSSAFSLSPSFVRCVRTVQTFPAKLYHSVSPAAQLKHQSLHCFLHTTDSKPGSPPAVPLHSTLQQHSRTRLQAASSLQQAKRQAKLSHAEFYLLLQDSYNTSQKEPVSLSISPKSKRYTCQSTPRAR